MPKRHNKKGRSTTERFVALPHYMLHSPAWRALSSVARAVFIELMTLYNGGNNGHIAFSARTGAERVRCSKATAARALVELQEVGFIEISTRGAFHRKTPHATEWRLTLHRCDRTGELPSKAFMRAFRSSENSKRGLTGETAGIMGETANVGGRENRRLVGTR